MSFEPNEHRGSKSAPEQTNFNPGFESTAPRRTIRKKQRNKCIKVNGSMVDLVYELWP